MFLDITSKGFVNMSEGVFADTENKDPHQRDPFLLSVEHIEMLGELCTLYNYQRTQTDPSIETNE